MTTTLHKAFTCSVCGTISEHEIVVSTSEIDLPDLDMRPGFPKRNIVHYSVQACPECGYCNIPISTLIEGAAEIMQSDVYRRQLTNPDFPELVNKYLCLSILKEKTGDLRGAGWSCIHASWICDDAGAVDAARSSRLRAVELLRAADVEISDQVGMDNVLYADLLRRSGAFQEARAQCEMGLKKEIDEIIKRCLEFERELIDWGETGRYNLDYIVDPGPEPSQSVGRSLAYVNWERRRKCHQELHERRQAQSQSLSPSEMDIDFGEAGTKDDHLTGKFE